MSEGYVDPIAQRLMDAQSRFDHKNAETQFNVKGYKTRRVWKGNHHRCKHETGVCDAQNAWLVSGPALERGQYPFAKIVIDMNMEKRAQGGQVVEYPDHLDIDPELLYKAKGFRSVKEVEGFDKIRPSERLELAMVERHLHEVDKAMEIDKAPWTERQKAKEDLKAKFDAALKPAPKAKGKD